MCTSAFALSSIICAAAWRRNGDTYVNMGRVHQVRAYRGNALQAWRTYTFWRTGALQWKSNVQGTISFEYDAQGRVIRQHDNFIMAENIYVYNAANNITQSMTMRNGAVYVLQTIEYDEAQRPHRIYSNGDLLVTYTYDANGNRTSAIHGNLTRTDYTFNLANQVTRVVNRRNSTALVLVEYCYDTGAFDLASQATRVVKRISGAVLSQFVYTYYLDGHGKRMKSETCNFKYIY